MAKRLAVIEIDETSGDVRVIKDYGSIDPATYEAFVNEGQEAVKDWQIAVQNLFMVMAKNGLVTPQGFNFEGFTVSSFVDFIMWAKNKLPVSVRNDFKYKLFDKIVLSSVSKFSSAFSEKGREIRIDFAEMAKLLKPVGHTFIKYALQNQDIERAVGKDLREISES